MVNPERGSSAAAVLAGDASYDSLTSDDQATVRAEWKRRIDGRLESLDLRSQFIAEGRSWVELDDVGRVVRRTPEAPG